MVVTDDVLKKFGPKRSDVSGLRWNIDFILVTAEVSKLDKSMEVSLEQFPNIPSILVTAEVSKLDKSREVRAEHPANMKVILLVTAEVSKFDKSREVRDEQL